MNLPPSTFKTYPWSSVLQNTESEVIAQNIMKIRARLGDKWDLSWGEYKKERQKDSGFREDEKFYFDKVIKLIPDAIGAIRFSDEWEKAARNAK